MVTPLVRTYRYTILSKYKPGRYTIRPRTARCGIDHSNNVSVSYTYVGSCYFIISIFYCYFTRYAYRLKIITCPTSPHGTIQRVFFWGQKYIVGLQFVDLHGGKRLRTRRRTHTATHYNISVTIYRSPFIIPHNTLSAYRTFILAARRELTRIILAERRKDSGMVE